MSTVGVLATDTGHLTDLAAGVAHGMAIPLSGLFDATKLGGLRQTLATRCSTSFLHRDALTHLSTRIRSTRGALQNRDRCELPVDDRGTETKTAGEKLGDSVGIGGRAAHQYLHFYVAFHRVNGERDCGDAGGRVRTTEIIAVHVH
ncbi:hypothetical protein ACH47B_30490 [Rhodococcus sp. NPDC019627]|jgi:hypothetical protein|uniref:hypothetical protein n=1 Tax=unclassified Rhodococcus (in: high G+C Gram-positive bacteria) TaxID=192944 RepID=UPI0013203E24|nr:MULTISPECIES: hypothetical protein [unclassified Rhodococcus (in: high G+C Gram-positive bacteria)]QHE69483.1 hypothetical protein GFS60_03051 [Rhodococcus sp. WAY2]